MRNSVAILTLLTGFLWAQPSFTAANISNSANSTRSVYAADIDNDGDMDILSASYTDDKIAWYENDGAADPSFTARTITTSADGARSVYAADIDNDGDMDVLSASSLDDKIAWYENDGAADPSFTARSLSALPMTLTEESDMAAAAIIGESSRPKAG